MFSTLSAGNLIYVLDIKNDYNILTGQVNKVTPIRPKYGTFTPNYAYGQNYETVVDITAVVNGEQKEFKQVPSNAVVADFGSDAFVLADSKDAMIGHLNVTYQNSKAVVDSVDKNKTIMANCKKALSQINPSIVAEEQRDCAISDLQGRVDNLTNQVAQLVSALSSKQTNT